MTNPSTNPDATELRKRKAMNRFMSNIRIDGNHCWLWTGFKNERGYGRISLYGKLISAHRASLLLHDIELIPGLEVDHLCRNHACVNPRHLEQVTKLTNVRRGIVAEVNRARMLAKTHCKQGHEYTPDNTSYKDGYRICKICRAAASRRTYAKNRAEVLKRLHDKRRKLAYDRHAA